MTFGIAKESIPIKDDGVLDIKLNNFILETLKYREQRLSPPKKTSKGGVKNKAQPPITQKTSSPRSESGSNNVADPRSKKDLILVPRSMDVLMGRGLHPESRLGSMRLRHLLLERKEQYDNSTKAQKRQIMEEILGLMKESGCRFLRKVKGGYVECDESVAREKVSHGFRNMRSKEKRDNVPDGVSLDVTGAEKKTQQDRKRKFF